MGVPDNWNEDMAFLGRLQEQFPQAREAALQSWRVWPASRLSSRSGRLLVLLSSCRSPVWNKVGLIRTRRLQVTCAGWDFLWVMPELLEAVLKEVPAGGRVLFAGLCRDMIPATMLAGMVQHAAGVRCGVLGTPWPMDVSHPSSLLQVCGYGGNTEAMLRLEPGRSLLGRFGDVRRVLERYGGQVETFAWYAWHPSCRIEEKNVQRLHPFIQHIWADEEPCTRSADSLHFSAVSRCKSNPAWAASLWDRCWDIL